MSKPKASPLIFFFGLLAIIAIISLLGPEESALGANVRIVYLHGAWVLTAEVALLAAAIAGLDWLAGTFHLRAETSRRRIPPLVGGAGTDRHRLLGDLPAALAVGHAVQLERVVPGRAALPPRADFCRRRRATPSRAVDHPSAVADLAGKHPVHRRVTRGLRHCIQRHAPAALADLQLGELDHYRIFPAAQSC